MFHSNTYTSHINQLKDFLIHIVDIIVTSHQTQQKTFKIKQNFMPSYNLVYDLCNCKPSLQQKMLQQFKHSLSYFIQAYTQQSTLKNPFTFTTQNSKQAIKWFNNLWSKYIKFMICISKKVFAYLDRYYLPGLEQGSLYKVGLKVFAKNVCHQRNIKYFTSCYFKQLRQIRQNKIIQNNDLLKFSQAIAIIDYPELITNLANSFLDETIIYYKSYFSSHKNLTSIQYYSKAHNLYLFEKTLIQMCICLNMFQIENVFIKFSQQLIQPFTSIFLQSSQGIQKMFKTKNIQFMKIINQIYSRFEGFQKIKQKYYILLIEQSQQQWMLNKEKTNNKNNQCIVDLIYDFYKSHLNLITIGFNKRNDMLITLNNGIQKIISKQDKLINILYDKTSLSRKNNTFNEIKDKITLLFEKISSKDQFVSLYQKQLLMKICENTIQLQKQEEFVFYLNQICGSELTHKLINKIKDYQQCREEVEEIKSNLLPIIGINFNISILSSYLWEKRFVDQVSLNITMPERLSHVWQTIEKSYSMKNQKKKLIILPFQNKLAINVRFNSKEYLIKMNLAQACVFMYLCSKSYTSEQQMIVNLTLQKSVLQNVLQTFQSINGLVFKTSLGDYLINWQFKHVEQTRKEIDIVSKIQQSKHITKSIKQDRQILVQAAIVKFVKRSKKATFQQLVLGVNNSIKLFKPQPSIIKAAVDKLIKKGFLQEEQNGILVYVD